MEKFILQPCNARLKIGRQIAELRKQQGLTLLQLSELTGLDNGNISRIETGRYSTGIDVLDKLANALGCEIQFIKKNN